MQGGGAYAKADFQRAYAKADFQRAYAKADLQRAYAKAETAGSTDAVRPGVVPAASASDHLLVSRASRKILSPFGEGGMYSALAPRRAVWRKADYQRARPKAAPRPNYNGLGPRQGHDQIITG